MQSFLGCDAHKHYSVFVAVDERGKATRPVRIEHNVAAHQRYLDTLPNGTEIAIESAGNWYWIVDLMEQAGHRPHLANPSEAKKRMGKTQDRRARRQGTRHPAPQWDTARELDSSWRTPRPARAAANQDGSARSPHLAQAPYPLGHRSLRTPHHRHQRPPRGQGSRLHCRDPSRPSEGDGTHGLA